MPVIHHRKVNTGIYTTWSATCSPPFAGDEAGEAEKVRAASQEPSIGEQMERAEQFFNWVRKVGLSKAIIDRADSGRVNVRLLRHHIENRDIDNALVFAFRLGRSLEMVAASLHEENVKRYQRESAAKKKGGKAGNAIKQRKSRERRKMIVEYDAKLKPTIHKQSARVTRIAAELECGRSTVEKVLAAHRKNSIVER